MIIKALWKLVKFITMDTPVPEVAFCAGAMLSNLTTWAAYRADHTEEKDISDEYFAQTTPIITVKEKVSPADVFERFSPLYTKFNPAEGIEMYKQLDDEGKFIFKLQVATTCCYSYFAIAMVARNLKGVFENTRLEQQVARDQFAIGYARDILDKERDDCNRIIDYYNKDGFPNNPQWMSDDNAKANYKNQFIERDAINDIFYVFDQVQINKENGKEVAA